MPAFNYGVARPGGQGLRQSLHRLQQSAVAPILSRLFPRIRAVESDFPSETAALCELCRNAPFFDLPKLKRSAGPEDLEAYTDRVLTSKLRGASYPFILGHTPHPPGFKHQPGLDMLHKSAQTCELCAIIEACVRRFIPHLVEYLNDEVARSLRPGFDPPKSFQLWLSSRRQDAPGFIIYTDSPRGNNVFEMGEVAFVVRNEDLPLHQKFPGRVIQDYPGTEETLNRAREWLNSCQETHPLCRLGEIELPTRVLDVRSRRADGMVRLLDTGAERASYATLSYCWGTSGNLQSTTATVGLSRGGIKIDELPKTVRDAVAITQHFGLQYLWVDALCIIQDDPQDWDREAQSMARVYANAYVNISALGAADTSQGCFMRRPPDRGAVPLEYYRDDGKCYQVFATIVTQTDMGSEKRDLSGYPTSTRAWTLQERMLARRTLHFGTEQMFFECAQDFRSEDGFVEPRRDWETTVPESLFHEEEFINGDMAGTYFHGYEGWTRLVTIYGTRRLTKSSDKLPAFSGIAQRYEGMLKDVYVAGLWKSRLIEDLHWSSESWVIPPRYRAPSWSWMSIDGPIFMPDMKEKKMGQKCATVLDYHLELKGQNPYGELTGGWLKIEAPLAEVIDGRIFGFEVGKGGLSVFVEVPPEEFDRLRIFTLFLYITGDVPWTALLITPVEDSGLGGGCCYRRVGKVTNLSWKKWCEIPDKAVCTLV
ncbi:MAG: hypothetical protein M1813_005913 [Trichoglossum hirsutum]|nr:MAG: hypothetical protein M1813_005913 [Trichoglossum hirsutum]